MKTIHHYNRRFESSYKFCYNKENLFTCFLRIIYFYVYLNYFKEHPSLIKQYWAIKKHFMALFAHAPYYPGPSTAGGLLCSSQAPHAAAPHKSWWSAQHTHKRIKQPLGPVVAVADWLKLHTFCAALPAGGPKTHAGRRVSHACAAAVSTPDNSGNSGESQPDSKGDRLPPPRVCKPCGGRDMSYFFMALSPASRRVSATKQVPR